MFERFMKWLKHRHTFVKIDWYETEDRDMRYSMRLYECSDPECEKKKWVDGRFDPYA